MHQLPPKRFRMSFLETQINKHKIIVLKLHTHTSTIKETDLKSPLDLKTLPSAINTEIVTIRREEDHKTWNRCL